MRSTSAFARLLASVVVCAALGCVEKQEAPPQQQPQATNPPATPQGDDPRPKIPKGIPIKKGPGIGALGGGEEPVVHTAMPNANNGATPPPAPAPSASAAAPSGSK